jgi:hypothetical protein
MILVVTLTAVSASTPARADPLTIMAVVGVAAVLSASSVDMVARSYDDDRDMRAQAEEPRPLIAKNDAPASAPESSAADVAKP